MRPTLQYVKEKYCYYNNLCFGGELDMPSIRLNLRRASLGLTNRMTGAIEISIREDLPEEEYIDTIVHEMIHYYILKKGIKDDAPHGKEFRRIMNEIIQQHGIKITIQYEPTDEELINQHDYRSRFVIVITNDKGKCAFAVVAKNKLLEIYNYFVGRKDIAYVKIYSSDRKIFACFPVQIYPLVCSIEQTKLSLYLTGSELVSLTDLGSQEDG